MSHNSEKVYFEQLARLLLETFLPNDYQGLTISDKPDLLMGEDHGIEVTRAVYEGDGQASGIFQHIKMKSKDQVDSRHLQTFDKIGYEVIELNGIIGGYSPREATWVNNELLKRTFERKAKIVKQYQSSITDLFIFSPFSEWFEEYLIHDFMIWAEKHGGSAFSKIIVFEYPYIFLYSSKESTFSKISIDREPYLQCCEIAREIAIKAK